MSWAKQSIVLSSIHWIPQISVWQLVETYLEPSLVWVGDPVVLLFTSTTIGSCAVINALTASSWGKLLTSVPFTCKSNTSFNWKFKPYTKSIAVITFVETVKQVLGTLSYFLKSWEASFYKFSTTTHTFSIKFVSKTLKFMGEYFQPRHFSIFNLIA